MQVYGGCLVGWRVRAREDHVTHSTLLLSTDLTSTTFPPLHYAHLRLSHHRPSPTTSGTMYNARVGYKES